MSLVENYKMASLVRRKLTQDSRLPKVSLRSLVLQANMLDNILDDIDAAKLGNQKTVAFELPKPEKTKVQEFEIVDDDFDDDFDDSSDDDYDDYSDDYSEDDDDDDDYSDNSDSDYDSDDTIDFSYISTPKFNLYPKNLSPIPEVVPELSDCDSSSDSSDVEYEYPNNFTYEINPTKQSTEFMSLPKTYHSSQMEALAV